MKNKIKIYDIDYLITSSIITIIMIVYGLWSFLWNGFNWLSLALVILGIVLLAYSLVVNISIGGEKNENL